MDNKSTDPAGSEFPKAAPIRRRGWALLAAVLAFSLVLGLVNLFQYMDSPFASVPLIDEESYVEWAASIVKGDPIPVFYQDPLYPYFLAAVFKITGVPETGKPHNAWFLVRFLQVLMGTGAVMLVFYSGRKLAGNAAGLFAALMLSLYKGVYFYELLLVKTSLSMFVAAAVLAAGVSCAVSPFRKKRWAVLGVLLGAAALLRGNFLALVPVVMAWALLYDRPGLKRGLLRSALIFLGALVAISPATIHNVRAGDFVLTTSQGGPNFYIGNNPQADGSYVKLPFQESAHPDSEARDFEKEAEKRTGKDLSPSQVSRFWFRAGLGWIAERPFQAFGLFSYKLLLMVHSFEIPDNQSFYVVREQFVPALWVSFMNMAIFWAPAIAGMVAFGFSDKRWTFVVLLVLVYSLSAAAFFIFSRYRLAVAPSLAVLSAGFVVWSVKNYQRKARLIVSFVAIAAVLIAGHWPIHKENQWQAYNILGVAHIRAGSPHMSIEHFLRALEMQPDAQSAQRNLRIAMDMLPPEPGLFVKEADKCLKQGDKRTATLFYEKALQLKPGMRKVRLHLARLYGPDMGRYEDALYHLKIVLKQNPGDAGVMVMIGNCYYEMDELGKAGQWWRKALEVDPDNRDARQNLKTLQYR